MNTESAEEDIEDTSVGRRRLRRHEDNVVHQTLHGHVETVGISQDLDVEPF